MQTGPTYFIGAYCLSFALAGWARNEIDSDDLSTSEAGIEKQDDTGEVFSC